MKRSSKVVPTIVFLAVLAFAAAPVQAVWYYTHGSAGTVEAQIDFNVVSSKVYNWGLEVVVKKGGTAQVTFPLAHPSQDGIYVDKIQFVWYTSAKNVSITDVLVCDAYLSIFEKRVNIPGTVSFKTTTVAMDRKYEISYGLGITLQVKNRGTKDQKITFCSVGVNLGEN